MDCQYRLCAACTFSTGSDYAGTTCGTQLLLIQRGLLSDFGTAADTMLGAESSVPLSLAETLSSPLSTVHAIPHTWHMVPWRVHAILVPSDVGNMDHTNFETWPQWCSPRCPRSYGVDVARFTTARTHRCQATALRHHTLVMACGPLYLLLALVPAAATCTMACVTATHAEDRLEFVVVASLVLPLIVSIVDIFYYTSCRLLWSSFIVFL